MTDIERYADKAMYPAAPLMQPEGNDSYIEPQVHLLWMTEDPLGAIAAACRMYEGKPTYTLAEISEEERWHYAEQVQKTHLKAPLEFVKFHFFLEAVPRSFTHQHVRQRTAVYAQESLRFAVKEHVDVNVPPSIRGSGDNEEVFFNALAKIEEAYHYLIANGVPAEDARELLPQATSTRLHYCTDLRNLADHAGNRLCTQAQFIWRKVFMAILSAIHDHSERGADLVGLNLFKPVCYQLGHCPFKATFDRGCTIRERVDIFERHGVPSNDWAGIGKPAKVILPSSGIAVDGINTSEWLDDERAAWVR